MAAAQWLLRPEDTKAVAESALWSLASAANLYFWLHGQHGYFAPESAEQPLLHLWSLGVEEQFYLIWPLLLALAVMPLWRRVGPATAMATVGLLAFASLGLGYVASTSAPDFAYYALPTRASGLLAGALLAMLVGSSPAVRVGHPSAIARDDRAGPGRILGSRGTRALREALAWTGAALLVGSGWSWIDDQAPYPGLAVLWPTLGTALLLVAAAGTGDPRHASGAGAGHSLQLLLASRPMVAIGRISYAAYLWHWPLLAFYRYGHGAPDLVAGLALIVATLLLATTSTYLLEQPLRQQRAPPGRTAITLLITPGLLLASTAALLLHSEGVGVRAGSSAWMDAWQRAHVDSRSTEGDPSVCQRMRLRDNDLHVPRCLGGTREADTPTVLLWGDSHAAHFAGTLNELGAAGGFRVRNAAHLGCPPLLVDPAGLTQRQDLDDCRASLAAVRVALPAYRDVIIAASWYSYGYRAPDFRARFEATLDRLQARRIRVTLIGRIPLMPGFDRLCEEKALSYPGLHCPRPLVRMQAIVDQENTWLRAVAARRAGVTYVDPTPHLCPGGICAAHDGDGTLLYFDANHLSIAGSRILGTRILRSEGVPAAFSAMARRDNSPDAI